MASTNIILPLDMQTIMIKIDKNIPLPQKGGASKYKKTFDDMNVGDSFKVNIMDISAIRTYMYGIRGGLGEKFTSRKEGEDIRIWRTK